MQTYDLIMLAVLIAATAFGAWKGLAWQIASFASITLSYIVALNFRDPVANMLGAEPPWSIFVAMFLLFVGTSAVVWLIFGFVQEIIEKIKLKDFDRHTGAVLGFGKGILFCVIITLFAVTLLSPIQREHIIHSQSGYYIAMLLDNAKGVVPAEIHDVIHPAVNELENHQHVETGFTSVDGANPGNYAGAGYPNEPTGQPNGQPAVNNFWGGVSEPTQPNYQPNYQPGSQPTNPNYPYGQPNAGYSGAPPANATYPQAQPVTPPTFYQQP